MNIKATIKDFEKRYACKVVYITQYGSKLFGTDNPNSDTDYKGIFIPSKKDVLLKKDIEHYNFNTNSTNTKNEKDDIDLQLYSVYKWFNLLKKGETGAMDLLFSLFRKDTQVYNDEAFTTIIMQNYTKFYNCQLHSFIGYCVGQSKMYNIKGERFSELHFFVEYFKELAKDRGSQKLEVLLPKIEEIIKTKNFKYIKSIIAPTAHTNQKNEGIYVEVLGKRFLQSVTVEYFSQKIIDMEHQFGNRARASAKGVDFKALSHAVRVIDEVEELIDDGFITFPLKNRVYITSVKEGNIPFEEVSDYIDKKLTIVQKKLEESKLPLKSDEVFMDELLLSFVV